VFERQRYKVFDFLTKKDSLLKYEQLREIQHYSTGQLLDIQREKLQKLVSHAYTNTDYYNELFNSLGLRPVDIECTEDLVKLPVLTKRIIKENYDRMKSTGFASFSPRIRATSGSTGEAFHFVIDRNSHSWVHAYMLLAWETAGFEFGDKVVRIGGGNIKVNSFYRFILSKLKNTIDIPAFDFSEDRMRQVIGIINKAKPGIIYGYSSALALLAKYSLANSIAVYSPKGVVTSAENLLPHNRDRIESAFKTEVYDQYGVMECGISAFECHKHKGLHIGMTKGIVEIVDECDRPVLNSPGRILGTDLDNFAFPIIRYDSGDIGMRTERQCTCDIGFEILDSVVGRTREFLTASDGKKVHGAIFSYLVRENPWINQYQVYQKEAGKIVIRIVTDTELTKQHIQSVQKYVQDKFGDKLEAEVLLVPDIPISGNNKRHFVVSEISNI